VDEFGTSAFDRLPRNLSKTERAKLLIFHAGDKNAPLVIPVEPASEKD
jgi:hypothetical protein